MRATATATVAAIKKSLEKTPARDIRTLVSYVTRQQQYGGRPRFSSRCDLLWWLAVEIFYSFGQIKAEFGSHRDDDRYIGECSYSTWRYYADLWNSIDNPAKFWNFASLSFEKLPDEWQQTNIRNWTRLTIDEPRKALRLPPVLNLSLKYLDNKPEYIPIQYVWIYNCTVKTATNEIIKATFYYNLVELVRQAIVTTAITQQCIDFVSSSSQRAPTIDDPGMSVFYNPVTQKIFSQQEIERMFEAYSTANNQFHQFAKWLKRVLGLAEPKQIMIANAIMQHLTTLIVLVTPSIPALTLKWTMSILSTHTNLWEELRARNVGISTLVKFVRSLESYYVLGYVSINDVSEQILTHGVFANYTWMKLLFGGVSIQVLIQIITAFIVNYNAKSSFDRTLARKINKWQLRKIQLFSPQQIDDLPIDICKHISSKTSQSQSNDLPDKDE